MRKTNIVFILLLALCIGIGYCIYIDYALPLIILGLSIIAIGFIILLYGLALALTTPCESNRPSDDD